MTPFNSFALFVTIQLWSVRSSSAHPRRIYSTAENPAEALQHFAHASDDACFGALPDASAEADTDLSRRFSGFFRLLD